MPRPHAVRSGEKGVKVVWTLRGFVTEVREAVAYFEDRGLPVPEPPERYDPLDVDFTFGDIDSIPRNEVVPQSDFDSEGTATWQRSAKRGYEGRMYTFLDYECENGFRFRAKTTGG